MSVITISRGCYSRGSEVAQILAKKLGYDCISREILLDASNKFHIPEIKLNRAIHDAPSILDRFTHGKAQYIAYIRAALLNRVRKDNVVYHGMAGHFFLLGIPHILKVRIISDMEDRIKEEMKREGISSDEARNILVKDDDERRKWGLHLYGADTSDASLYDLVINIKGISIDDAVEIIRQTVNLPAFQTTSDSKRCIDDMAMASQVQSDLVNTFPSAMVNAQKGIVKIHVEGTKSKEKEIVKRIRQITLKTEGVKDIEVQVIPGKDDLMTGYKMLHFE